MAYANTALQAAPREFPSLSLTRTQRAQTEKEPHAVPKVQPQKSHDAGISRLRAEYVLPGVPM